MLEIPNLNKIYEDETGSVYLLDLDGNLSIHVFVIPTTDRAILNHYREVMAEIGAALREKGLTSIKGWVQTDEQYRFALFFGFVPTGNEITILGYHGSPIYEVEMDLT